jgi:hypothetical protein
MVVNRLSVGLSVVSYHVSEDTPAFHGLIQFVLWLVRSMEKVKSSNSIVLVRCDWPTRTRFDLTQVIPWKNKRFEIGRSKIALNSLVAQQPMTKKRQLE